MAYQACYIIHSYMQIMRNSSINRTIMFVIYTRSFFASVSQNSTHAWVPKNEKVLEGSVQIIFLHYFHMNFKSFHH